MQNLLNRLRNYRVFLFISQAFSPGEEQNFNSTWLEFGINYFCRFLIYSKNME